MKATIISFFAVLLVVSSLVLVFSKRAAFISWVTDTFTRPARKSPEPLRDRVRAHLPKYRTRRVQTNADGGKLIVYMFEDKACKNLVRSVETDLPTEVHGYISILPADSKTDPLAFDIIRLPDLPLYYVVSHNKPLAVYCDKEKKLRIYVNPENRNPSSFQGEKVTADLLLEEVSSKENECAKIFRLCGAPIAMVYKPAQAPEEQDTVDLNALVKQAEAEDEKAREESFLHTVKNTLRPKHEPKEAVRPPEFKY